MNASHTGYGIHLTADSAYAAFTINDFTQVIKSDIHKDGTPLAIGWDRKGTVFIGDKAKNQVKRDFLTGRTSSFIFNLLDNLGVYQPQFIPNLGRELLFEEVLADFLKVFKSKLDIPEGGSVVLSHPPGLDVMKCESLNQAAAMAGLGAVTLIESPVAATIGCGRVLGSSIISVYVGEMECDVTLVSQTDGIFEALATRTAKSVGWRQLHEAIIAHFLMPSLQESFELRQILSHIEKKTLLIRSLQYYAEAIWETFRNNENASVISGIGDNIGCDDNGDELDFDLQISSSDIFSLVQSVFQPVSDMVKSLLTESDSVGKSVDGILLIGENIDHPVFMELLAKETGLKIISEDPETLVVRGAAIFAASFHETYNTNVSTHVPQPVGESTTEFCPEAPNMTEDATEGEPPDGPGYSGEPPELQTPLDSDRVTEPKQEETPGVFSEVTPESDEGLDHEAPMGPAISLKALRDRFKKLKEEHGVLSSFPFFSELNFLPDQSEMARIEEFVHRSISDESKLKEIAGELEVVEDSLNRFRANEFVPRFEREVQTMIQYLRGVLAGRSDAQFTSFENKASGLGSSWSFLEAKQLFTDMQSFIIDHSPFSGTADDLISRLITIYADHPEINEEKFRSLFDELSVLSESTKLTNGEERRLKLIDYRIESLK